MSLRGDATDQFPIAHVGVKVYNASGTLLAPLRRASRNSWQYNFPSVGLVAGIENCDLVVTATDRAGNSGTRPSTTPPMFNSGSLSLSRWQRWMPAVPRSGRSRSRQTLPCCRPGASSRQGLDLPVFDIYNPDPGGTAENVLAPSSKAIGMVTHDAEGVNAGTIQIKFDSGAWSSVGATVGLRGALGAQPREPRPREPHAGRGRTTSGRRGIPWKCPSPVHAPPLRPWRSPPTQGAYLLNSTSFRARRPAATP